MFKKLHSIRYTFVGSHIKAVLFSTIFTLTLLLFIFVAGEPTWLTSTAIFVSLSSAFVIGIVVSVYISFQVSGHMKGRIEALSVYISTISNGKYGAKLLLNDEHDEISRLSDDLNSLAKKMQSQVKSLQRLADEKSDFADAAHKAATMEERQRLARDLHDAVSQQLFALSMMSQATLKVFDRDPKRAKEQLEEITQMSLQAQTEMRALLLHLRPVHLSGESLTNGILALIEELKQKCQIDFKIEMEEVDGVSKATEDHLFRMIQESLSNILRHADATEVKLYIRNKPSELFLHISDNGNGFDLSEDKKTSYGLKTMQERCEEIGGTFAIRSKKGEGTHIDIRIPITGGENDG